jgi:Phospholipase_D-nuclease N-terminal
MNPVMVLIVAFFLGFWLWALVDCATKEPNEASEKFVWIVVIVFTNFAGALLYYFVRRPKRIATFGK